jgi:hypothetical protein
MGSRFISAVHGHRPQGTALETRFLCSISAPAQSRIQVLIDLWDQGHRITLREELIREEDFILMPPSWGGQYFLSSATWLVGAHSRLHHANPMHSRLHHANPMFKMLWHGSDFVPVPYF